MLTVPNMSASAQNEFSGFIIQFEQHYDDPWYSDPTKPKDDVSMFRCLYYGDRLEFSFEESMGVVHITLVNLTDGTQTEEALWTPCMNHSINVMPDTPYNIIVTTRSGETFIGHIN